MPRSSIIVWLIALALLTFFIWAYTFRLDEVTTGVGKVIPTSREQIIQSLEGGIIAALNVKEGDVVERGQVLAQLDRTRIKSTVDESASRVNSALATAARLRAEVTGEPLVFPARIREDAALVRSETALYNSRRESLDKSLKGLAEALRLVRKELQLTEALVRQGAASDVEVLRLKRQANELEMKSNDTLSQYFVKAHEELAKANAEVEAQESVMQGRADMLSRMTITSPVRGVVKDVTVTTVGGVIPPNGRLMAIVPIEDQLLVEVRISPRDVAFIHPGQPATVKVTAYDYSIYGALTGRVTMISPDTIQDDVKRDVYYYRVFVRTDADALLNRKNERFPIFPGMITTVDVSTGNKTIWEYLIKPLNRAKEALRER
ncbi:HlyD family efflux transporter periplasmic adaptor subunit [Ectopseudomonas mendocina]|uniref:HlyD family efflux transporter periplasmic adaptor subunit n=1 Tax=Ectopseudomonas mendocina TaxID=300 RepID=A0ABZ2RLZ2_ECTME